MATGRDDGPWNQCKTKQVGKTSGESKNFEGRIVAKSKIIKNQWKYVAFLTTPNRHVRQTIGNVMRAQRSKIKERGLNQELLTFIWNMYRFWLAGVGGNGKRNV